ncbi:hypothetical protein [Agrobacterium tumefaciens]|uniref:hypothetical protein n=1 Tax=Agrobacterium tumefaciens TaxID=358 RepID=UPI001572DB75|nr:hypothetical protein [Agrobacterium tumefaciens]NTD12101.1 hypothetical protein [Agrobacterium tumefaciens]
MRKLIILSFLLLWATESNAEENPAKTYWEWVVNVENVPEIELENVKNKAISTLPKKEILNVYIKNLTEVSIKHCDKERIRAVQWRAAYKGESLSKAEERIKKIDELAPEMLKINIGQSILLLSNKEN